MGRRLGGSSAVGLILMMAGACSNTGGHQATGGASGSAGAGGGPGAGSASDAGAPVDGALPEVGAAPCRTLAPQANQVQFAAGGAILYAGGYAPNLIDTRSWTVKQLFSANNQPAFLSTISSDGAFVATFGGDQLLHVWNAANGAELGQVAATLDTASVFFPYSILAFAPDGSRIAAVDGGTDVRVFARAGLAQAWRATATAAVGWVAFSGDGQTVLVAQPDRVLRFDAGTGATKPPIMIAGASGAVGISGDGQLLAVDTAVGMQIVRVSDGSIVHTLPRTSGQLIALSRDGGVVATSPVSGPIAVTDVATGAVLRTFSGAPIGLALSPDGSSLAEIQDNVVVWRVSDGSLLYEAGGRERAVGSPVADLLASDTGGEAAFIWDLSNGALTRRIPVTHRADVISSLTFDAGGKLFMDAFSHGELWDLSAGTFTSISYNGSSQPPEWSAAGALITSDHQWIVSGGDATDGGAVRVWSVATGTVVRRFHAHDAGIDTLALDPTETLLATAGPEVAGTQLTNPQDNDIKIWDFASGTRLHTLVGHSASIHWLAFSPDSTTLLSGGNEGLVRLWSVADGSVVRDFAAANQPNTASPPQYGLGVAFSPNGRLVASGGYDPPPGANSPVVPANMIAIWATDTGALVRRLDAWGQLWGVTLFGWSADGRYLAAPGPAAINVWCIDDLGGGAP